MALTVPIFTQINQQVLWTSLVPNVIPLGRKMQGGGGGGKNLICVPKYGFHCTNFRATLDYSTVLCRNILHRPSPK